MNPLPNDASTDQTNCPDGYYRRSNGMVMQLPEQREQQSLSAPISLDAIDSMDVEGLRKLIRMVAGAIWGYALLSDEERAEAARLKLYNMGMTANEVHKVVPALDKWFDRTEGKATQRIEQRIEHNHKTASHDLTNVQLIEALRLADIAGLLPSNAKLLDNGDVVLDAEYQEII